MNEPASGGPLHQQSPLRGVLWMAAAAVFFSVSFGVVRHLSDNGDIHAFQQAFFRQVFGTLVFLPIIFRHGLSSIRTRQPIANLTRVATNAVALVLAFWGVTLIPLAQALTLQSTVPFFAIIFAMLVVNERPGPHRWAAVMIGFAGALVILRPGIIGISLGMTVAVASAAFYGFSDAFLRKVARTDGTISIIFFGFAVQVPLLLPLAIMHWTTPALSDWPWILAMVILSFGAQFSLSKAYINAEASIVSPVLFIRIPMVAVIGFIFFDQIPDMWVWIGAAVIFVSTVYAARREALIHRRV